MPAIQRANGNAADSSAKGSPAPYYYSQGKRQVLFPSSKWVGLELEDSASAKAVESEARTLGSDPTRAVIRHLGKKLLIAPLRPEASPDQKKQFRERLLKSPGVRRAIAAFDQPGSDLPLTATGEVLAQFKREVTRDQIDALVATAGAEIVRPLGAFAKNGFVLRLKDPAGSPIELANSLYESGMTVFSHPDFLAPGQANFVPNDPYYSQLWFLNNTGSNGRKIGADVSAEKAWNITRGGSSIRVAIFDCGVDIDHEDFAGKVAGGYDYFAGSADPRPKTVNDNHGTACAGIALANGNNGIGTSGIAPNCQLFAGRVYEIADNGGGLFAVSGVAQAFNDAVSGNIDVISCSWFMNQYDVVDTAINYAAQEGRGGKGCVICFSSGNSNVSVPQTNPQATLDSVICVAASTYMDERAPYSNYGPAVAVCAPSSSTASIDTITSLDGCLSTDRTGTSGYSYSNYSYFGGTSSACPLVAGVAALVLSQEPDLTAAQVKSRLESTADQIDTANGNYDSTGHSDWYGFGRVNAFRALAASDQTPPSLTITGPSPWSYGSGFLSISGTVADAQTGPGESLDLVLSHNGKYWSGSAWVDSTVTLHAGVDATGSWSFSNIPTGANQEDGSYHLAATAYDLAGNSVSHEFDFYLQHPQIAITSGTAVKNFESIAGSASPGGSGSPLDGFVYLTIEQNGKYWNGSTWVDTRAVLKTAIDLSNNWSFPTDGLALPNNEGAYNVTAYVQDQNGITSVPIASGDGANQLGVTVDRTPPTCAILQPANGTVLTSKVSGRSWFNGTSSDSNGAQPGLTLYLRRLRDGLFWDGRRWQYADANSMYRVALTGTFTSFDAWQSGAPLPGLGASKSRSLVTGSYDFIAIAQDAAGNSQQADSFTNVLFNIDYGSNIAAAPQTPPVAASAITTQDILQYEPLPAEDGRTQSPVFLKRDDNGNFYTGIAMYKTVGYDYDAVSYPSAAIVKHSPGGAQLWRRERTTSSVTVQSQGMSSTRYYEQWSPDQEPVEISDQEYGGYLSLAATEVDRNGNVYAGFTVHHLQYYQYATSSSGSPLSHYGPVAQPISLIVKFDTDGNYLWSRRISSYDSGLTRTDVKALRPLSDGSVIAMLSGAYSNSYSQWWSQSILARIGSGNDFILRNGFQAPDWSASVEPTMLEIDSADNSYLVSRESDDQGDHHAIRKIDSSGNVLRTVSVDYSEAPEEWSVARIEPSTGVLYIGANYGGTDIYDQGGFRQLLMKFDLGAAAGDEMLWRRFASMNTATADENNVRLGLGADGNVTIASGGWSYRSSDYSDSNVYQWSISRFDTNGAMLWCRTMGDEDYSQGLMLSDLVLDSAGNALIVGTGYDRANYSYPSVFGKVASNGDSQFVAQFHAGVSYVDSNNSYSYAKSSNLIVLPDQSVAALVAVSSGTTTGFKVMKFSNPDNVRIPIALDPASPADQSVPVGGNVTLTVANSGSPARYQWRKNDDQGVPQPIASATSSSLTLFNVTSADAGAYSAVVTGIDNPSDSVTSRTATVQVYTVVGLNSALDNADLTFATGGDTPWQGQTLFAHDGGATAVSGNLANGQSNYLETQLTGPGIVKFAWKATNGYSDTYSVLLDGTTQATYYGYEWQAGSVEVPAGIHTVRWAFTAGSTGDTALLDEVTFGPEAPIVIPANQPVDQDALLGDYVTFSVTVTGDTPTYQWYKGDQALDGATGSTLSIYNASQADSGSYSVVVGNALGSGTSRTAHLTIIDPNAPDHTAPQLTALSVSPDSVDVTGTSAQIIIHAAITDNATGFSYGTAVLTDPHGYQHYYSLDGSSRIDGNSLNGTYEVAIQIPRGLLPGVWQLTSLSLTDRASSPNTANYGAQNSAFPQGSTTTVTVVNTDADAQPPVLVSASAPAGTLNVTGSSQNFTVMMRVTDDKSGFSYGYATLTSPSGKQQATGYLSSQGLVSGDELDGTYQVQFTISKFAEAGVWRLDSLTLTDLVGNPAYYAGSPGAGQVPFPAGSAIQASVQDSTPDLKTPVLASLNFTPQSVDVTSNSQQVSLSARITDVGSGFSYAYATFTSPSGDGQVSQYLSASDRVSGNALDGVYQGTLTVPQASEAGPWLLSLWVTDQTGNVAFYSNGTAQGALKFPSGTPATLNVRNGPDTIRFSASSFYCAQAEGKGLVRVVRVNGETSKASVKVSTQALGTDSTSAVAGTDYTSAAGVLTFNPGETVKTFTVTVKNTKVTGPDKSLGLVLSDVAGSTLGAPASATLTIANSNRVLSVGVSQPDNLPGGTVTAAFSGSTTRLVGAKYTIAAKPNPGFLFDHWEGGFDLTDAQRTNPTLTFTLEDDTDLTAVFVANLFPGVSGKYDGVVLSSATSNAASGFITITTTPTPAFTGALTVAGVKIPLSSAKLGVFKNDGSLSFPVIRPSDRKALTFQAQLDLVHGSGQLTGRLLDGDVVLSSFVAFKEPAYPKTTSAPETGAYTLALPVPVDGAAQSPAQTYGAATLSVKPTGVATLKGTLPDLASIGVSLPVSQGVLPVYVSLYKGAGALVGDLTFTAATRTWEGNLLWFRPGAPVATISVTGESYLAPSKGFHVLPALDASQGKATLLLGSGTGTILARNLQVESATSNAVVVSGTNPEGFTFTVVGSTGQFSGSYKTPGTKSKNPFNGVFLQDSNLGVGFAVEGSTPRFIEIVPPQNQ